MKNLELYFSEAFVLNYTPVVFYSVGVAGRYPCLVIRLFSVFCKIEFFLGNRIGHRLVKPLASPIKIQYKKNEISTNVDKNRQNVFRLVQKVSGLIFFGINLPDVPLSG